MDELAAPFKGGPASYRIGTPPRPVAAILTCSDARVVPELIFGLKPGDLFTVRLPGPILTPEVTAALEMGLGMGCRSVLVLGHTDCRAIRGERERVLEHHAIASRLSWATRNLPLAASLAEATEENIRQTVADLRSRLQADVEGAIFDLHVGQVQVVTC